MGYRSDVAYVIKFNDIQTRDAYVTLMLAHDNPYIRDAIEECEYNNARDPIITFRADDVKWYDSYEDVKAHTHIYMNAYDLEMGSYRFLAVGEDGKEEFDEETISPHPHLGDYIYSVHTLHTEF